MSGVEAAASLFGSDEPAADLFATLGTDSTPTVAPAADDFFASDTISPATAEKDLFSHSDYAAEASVFPEYPTQVAKAPVKDRSETVQYDQPPNGHAAQWGQQEKKSMTAEYSTTHYDPYAPSAYTPATTKTNYSSYSAYDPPPPTTAAAPVSPYTPYAPVSYAATAPTHSYAPAIPPPAPLSQPYGQSIASIPPVPPPKTTTVSRPKVSNAYDPPFIPSRRPARTTPAAISSYTQYQTPSQPSYSPQSAYSQYQNPPSVSHEPYRPPSTTTSPVNNYSSHSHSQSTGSSHSFGQSPDTVSSHYDAKASSSTSNGSYIPQDPVEHTPSTAPNTEGQNDQAYITSNEIVDSYVPVENGHAVSVSLPSEGPTPLSHDNHEERRPSLDSVLSDAVSPRTVPLPYSPPVQKQDLEDFEGGATHGENPTYLPSQPAPPPQQSPYIPQQPLKKDFSINKDVYDPYAPRLTQSANNYIPRTSSPLSLGARPNDLRKASVVPPSHLNGVTPSPYSAVPKPIVNVPPPPAVAPLKVLAHDDHSTRLVPHNMLGPQDIIMKGTSTQYAPSPSLLGANDPLSRTSARAPVITFGFGGKLITCFHGMPGLNAGFDVALSSRTSSELKIHTLKKIIPTTVLNMPGPSFPGPLLADPGTSSISLVRSGQTTQTKTKKTSLVTYLTDRFNEIQQGLGYLSTTEKQNAEDRLVLLKLLSIMVENDGRLLGTPQTDATVRTALVPRLENLTGLQDGLSLQASFSSPSFDEPPISVTTLKPSTLDKIEELLLQGDRRQAYQFAMDQKLWAHAMIIASSIDKESWKEVVNDFLRTELGSKEDAARTGPILNGIHHSQSNRESLRVAYSLFSGQGATAVQELAPVTLLQSASRLQPPPMLQTPPMLQPPVPLAAPAMTPRTPNFPPMVSTVPIPAETLAKWPETAAMIIASPLTPEVSGALTALGDQLQANNWVEAAHVCYLLSSQTTLLGGFGHPSARITLLGTKSPAEALKNPDVIVYSEILEFAMSLVPTAKGQEPFHGIPHLQAYRFMRAVLLAEIGEIQLANRYCEAIASSLSQGSPYTNVALLEQLQGLQQRLSGVFHGDKSGSWITGKISKPSLDTIGGWLEGRFTKLVTGESDSPTPTDHKATGQPFAGPFAHYSTISTTPSGRSSPQPAAVGLTSAPPHRTASAMATSSPYSQVNIERSSSAMDYVRQPPSQTSKNYAGSLSSSQSSPTGYGFNGHSRYDDIYSTSSQPKASDDEPPAPQSGSWWNSSGNDLSSTTPTATTFMQVDDSSIQPSSDGFISLMSDQNFVGPSQHHQQSSNSSSRYAIDEEEDDDLGLGNSKPKPKVDQEEVGNATTEEAATQPTKATPPPAPEKKNEPAQQSGGSWFGRWWKRSDPATPGPIKASLGEESAFYYDKEQKRWVNRKAGAEEAAKPATPPPPPSRAPSRAQTASPGMGGPKPQAQISAPPTRSASAIGLSAEPPNKAPMRIRSNLAPPTESAPSTPTGTRMNPTGPPPPARPKSGAAKRNIRSRYVDVFQQEAGGPAA